MHDDQTGGLGSQLPLKVFRSYGKGFGIHVHEHRTSSRMNDSRRRGKKRVGGNQNILAFDRQRTKNDFQRTGAAVHCDRVLSPAELGELLFEFRSIFPERQLPGAQDLFDPLRDPGPVFRQKLDLRGGDFPQLSHSTVWTCRYVRGPARPVCLLQSLQVVTAPFSWPRPCVLRKRKTVRLPIAVPSMGWTPIPHPGIRASSPPSDKKK